MLKIIGLAALALLVVLIIPVQSETETNDLKLYGYATMILHDVGGKDVFLQVVHNQLVNQGESLMLNNTFNDNSQNDFVPDSLQIGSICITNGMGSVNETDTAVGFNSTNGLGGNFNCKFDSVDITTTQGKAVVAPSAFSSDGVNIVNGQTIRGIGICTAGGSGGNSTNDAADMRDCHAAKRAALFAEVNTSDVTLNTGETVTITYTFDITSSSS